MKGLAYRLWQNVLYLCCLFCRGTVGDTVLHTSWAQLHFCVFVGLIISLDCFAECLSFGSLLCKCILCCPTDAITVATHNTHYVKRIYYRNIAHVLLLLVDIMFHYVLYRLVAEQYNPPFALFQLPVYHDIVYDFSDMTARELASIPGNFRWV